MNVRLPIAVGVAVLLMAAALMQAMVALPAARRPLAATKLWSDHPKVQRDRAMAEIGAAAARGQSVPASAHAAMRDLAARDPFRPEPFLVEGTIAQTAGDGARAERLFAEARRRDPRSAAARYFLADRFLRTNRIKPGLHELAVLSRLVPNATVQIIPALVTFAKRPEAVADINAFFASAPAYRELVLSELSADPANVDAIMALAKPGGEEAPANWQSQIIAQLVARGEYQRALDVWRRLTGIGDGGLIFNPRFRALPAPAPFNWSYPAGGAALVEPAAGGRLLVVYYGRENAVLATQLLLLSPGRYRLAMDVGGSVNQTSLKWTVTCLPENAVIGDLPVSGPGQLTGIVAVPAQGCGAQRLDLLGVASEAGRQADLSIGGFNLSRVSGQ